MRDIGYPSPGMVTPSGDRLPGGERPWSEIAAWQQCSGVELSPWESQLIYRLFIRYSNDKYHFTQHPNEPSPHCSDPDARRAAVGMGLKSMLSGMGKKK